MRWLSFVSVIDGNLPDWDVFFSHATIHLRRNKVLSSIPGCYYSDGKIFSVTVWLPAGGTQTDSKHFGLRDQGECRIAWTTLETWGSTQTEGPASMNHFNTLPNDWIPKDGPDFLIQFLEHQFLLWNNLCENAEDHMAQCVSQRFHHTEFKFCVFISNNTYPITALGSIAGKRRKARSHITIRKRCTDMVWFPQNTDDPDVHPQRICLGVLPSPQQEQGYTGARIVYGKGWEPNTCQNRSPRSDRKGYITAGNYGLYYRLMVPLTLHRSLHGYQSMRLTSLQVSRQAWNA